MSTVNLDNPKFLVVPDIHERARMVDDLLANDFSDFKRIILLGDYVDSFDRNPYWHKYLERICQLACDFPEKIVLLWGNHDVQYLSGHPIKVSGHQKFRHAVYNRIFEEHKHLFKYVHFEDGILFSHGGLSKGMFEMLQDLWDDDSDYEFLNDPSFEKYHNYLTKFHGGRNRFDGVLWNREYEVKLPNVKLQIVGHTEQKKVKVIKEPTLTKVVDTGELFYI